MNVTDVDPNDLQIDEMNERQSDIETDDLVESIEDVGVIQPPLVRDTDGTYEVVVGQRRTLAAREAEGVETIPVIHMDWGDKEALKASITENIALFSQSVSMTDRAEALERLWEMMGGEGMPVQSHLGAELGVPRETVRTWLEPLHDGWKDTSIDPTSDDSTDPDVEDLGERKLAEIRRMTGGGEAGEEIAQQVAEAGLTQADLKEARELVEDEDFDPDEAIDALTEDEDDDDSDSTSQVEASVQFDSETSVAVREYAEENDVPAGTVIVEAVQWFLRSEGHLEEN